jgi:hypothetical protein
MTNPQLCIDGARGITDFIFRLLCFVLFGVLVMPINSISVLHSVGYDRKGVST